MFQVTIIWGDAEIGYGEGQSESFARAEAIESVESIYMAVKADWTFRTVRS
jgi:hypothetical protein